MARRHGTRRDRTLLRARGKANCPPECRTPIHVLSEAGGALGARLHQRTGRCGDTLNLYDVSGLAHFELYRAIEKAGNPTGLDVSKQRLLNDMAFQIADSVANNASDPFQFGLQWATYDSNSTASGLSVMAAEYTILSRNQDYDDESRNWLGNISGANAWGMTFIVGDGDMFPDCMQHQVANIVGSTNGSRPCSPARCRRSEQFSAIGFLDGMVRARPEDRCLQEIQRQRLSLQRR